MGEILGAAGAVGPALQDGHPRQLHQGVVQGGGHLAGAAAVAQGAAALGQHAGLLVAVAGVVGAHLAVEVEGFPGLHHPAQPLAAHVNVHQTVQVGLGLPHIVEGGVGGDGTVGPQGIVRGGDGDQARELVHPDVAVGAPVGHHGPAVQDPPDGEHGAGLEHHPAVVLVAHRLANRRLHGGGADIGGLLHPVGRGVDRVHRSDLVQLLALDVAQLVLVAHHAPGGAHIQDVGPPFPADPGDHLGLGLRGGSVHHALGVDGGVVTDDPAGVDHGGVLGHLAELHLMPGVAHQEGGLVLILVEVVQIVDLRQLSLGELALLHGHVNLLLPLREGGAGQQHQGSHQKCQEPFDHGGHL